MDVVLNGSTTLMKFGRSKRHVELIRIGGLTLRRTDPGPIEDDHGDNDEN